MKEKRRHDDRIEETDEALAPASSAGDKDELLVGASGRADIAGRLVDEDEDVGEYEAEHGSLPPDYEYRVSTAVSDQYGVYPAPGDVDMPLGMTSDARLASEEALSYFPPEDPATLPDEDAEQGIEVAGGFGASLRDAGYDDEDLPGHLESGDLSLVEKVMTALQLSSLVTGFRLEVEVDDAVAYLSGVVSTFEDIAVVSSIVNNVPGIDDLDMDDVDVSDEDIEGVREVSSPQWEEEDEVEV